MSLISSVRSELLSRKGEWPRIATATSNSYSWLCKFAQGRMTNPGVRRLEAIDKYLRENPSANPDHAAGPAAEPAGGFVQAVDTAGVTHG